MDEDSKRVAQVGCFACFTCVVLLILILGWDSVEVTSWGLKCNKLSKTCADESKHSSTIQVYSPGRYLVGPFNHFIEFPGSMQAIEFSNNRLAKAPPLKTRTVEGLSLGLHVSFQYELIKGQIHELYSMNNLDYEQTFIRIARDTILQSAGDYEAPEYWQSRSEIAKEMLVQLNVELFKAHAKCIALQILDIELPQQYEDSIVTTQVEVQNKRMKEFEQKVAMIQNEIMVLTSKNAQEVYTIGAQADAEAYSIEQTAKAKANQIMIEAEQQTYSAVKKDGNLTDHQFDQYVYLLSLIQQQSQPRYMINAPKTLTYQIQN